MIIGFTERRRTVSERIVPEGLDEIPLTYPVAALRTSERDHLMAFRLQEGISTATVNTRQELGDIDDAIFGEVRVGNDPIQVSLSLASKHWHRLLSSFQGITEKTIHYNSI